MDPEVKLDLLDHVLGICGFVKHLFPTAMKAFDRKRDSVINDLNPS